MSKVINGIKSDLKVLPKNILSKVKGINVAKVLRMSIPYIIAGYVADKFLWAYRNTGGSGIPKVITVIDRFGRAFYNPLPSFYPYDLLIGATGGVIFRLIVYYRTVNAKKFRHGVEYGSAKWGTAKDIKPYVDPIPERNILLTKTESLTMESRPSNQKYARNKNVMIVGGSGSGKTRFYVKPQLMQMHSSYVVTDPKGQILGETGKMLRRGVPKRDEDNKVVLDKNGKTVYEPYKIKVLNTIDFSRSMHYNPFAYIRSEKDILKLVNTLMENTKGDGGQGADPFWDKAERLLYTVYIGYLWYEAPEEQNFSTLIQMIDMSDVREDDETYKNPVDRLFDELEARDENHFAVRQYRKYKLAAGVATCN